MVNPIRLSTETLDGLINVLTHHVNHHVAELRLYGSRTDTQRRGGDVDLILLVEHAEFAEQLNLFKHHILAQIKSMIGEQKIDLIITDRYQINKDPFLRLVMPNSIILFQWTNESSR